MEPLVYRSETNTQTEVLQNEPDKPSLDPKYALVESIFSIVLIASSTLLILIAGIIWIKTRHVKEFTGKPKMTLVLYTLSMVFLIGWQVIYEWIDHDYMKANAGMSLSMNILIFNVSTIIFSNIFRVHFTLKNQKLSTISIIKSIKYLKRFEISLWCILACSIILAILFNTP